MPASRCWPQTGQQRRKSTPRISVSNTKIKNCLSARRRTTDRRGLDKIKTNVTMKPLATKPRSPLRDSRADEAREESHIKRRRFCTQCRAKARTIDGNRKRPAPRLVVHPSIHHRDRNLPVHSLAQQPDIRNGILVTRNEIKTRLDNEHVVTPLRRRIDPLSEIRLVRKFINVGPTASKLNMRNPRIRGEPTGTRCNQFLPDSSDSPAVNVRPFNHSRIIGHCPILLA